MSELGISLGILSSRPRRRAPNPDSKTRLGRAYQNHGRGGFEPATSRNPVCALVRASRTALFRAFGSILAR
jgi:hypothetical protein